MTKVALGVDIGGTNTVFGLIDKNGKCVFESKIDTRSFETPNLLIKTVSSTLNKVLNDDPEIELIGIGVGAPNGNFHTGLIEYAPNLKWEGIIDLVSLFYDFFKVPVYVTNDANAAAIGEMTYGAAQQLSDFILVTLGTGLGSGFVSNGKLIYGHDGFAGELGHVIIDQNGRLCGCGRKGCLETYASATGIVKTAEEQLLTSNKKSILRKYTTKLSAKDIASAANIGDELAIEIFDFTAEKLAFGLANIVPITSPKTIVLFGGLANAGPLLTIPLKKYFESFLLKIYQNNIDIILSELKNNYAAILGASALVWNEIKKNG